MIKRNVKNGKVVASTTERLAPRIHASDSKTTLIELEETKVEAATRTCNSCIQGLISHRTYAMVGLTERIEFPEDSFVTCISCEDYDLCLRCHTKLKHGHSPKHAFAPAVDSVPLDPLAEALLHPGRNVRHNAVCDGCDKVSFPFAANSTEYRS
jgi:next-to-BRCA1 protein 1